MLLGYISKFFVQELHPDLYTKMQPLIAMQQDALNVRVVFGEITDMNEVYCI